MNVEEVIVRSLLDVLKKNINHFLDKHDNKGDSGGGYGSERYGQARYGQRAQLIPDLLPRFNENDVSLWNYKESPRNKKASIIVTSNTEFIDNAGGRSYSTLSIEMVGMWRYNVNSEPAYQIMRFSAALVDLVTENWQSIHNGYKFIIESMESGFTDSGDFLATGVRIVTDIDKGRVVR